MYTNIDTHGGKFIQVLDKEIRRATNVAIASGYTSLDILNRYKSDFYRISSNGGSTKLLLGMAFYEGLSQRKLAVLHEMAERLKDNTNSGIFVTHSRKYHGKIYKFESSSSCNIYLGSSNFSRSGLSENIEATTIINDEDTHNQVNNFLDFLFCSDYAVSITDAEITVLGTKRYNKKISLKSLDDLKRHDPKLIDKSLYAKFDFPLSRVAEKEKSNLNVYFGKGRWSRKTGLVRPRPWYEVELIANADINQNPLYPRGNFDVYTDDGYVIPMKTSGDYFKNIRSRGNLKLLGQWIKAKLQKAGALIPLTPVTQDTLDLYGKDVISFYKIENGRYYMEF